MPDLVPIDHDPFAGELELPVPSMAPVEKPKVAGETGEPKRQPATLIPIDYNPFA